MSMMYQFKQPTMYGYYDEAIGFMRNLLSSAFKDNSYLEKAMITGISKSVKGICFLRA